MCDNFPVYLLFLIIFSVQPRSYDGTVGQSLADNAYEQGDDEGSTHTPSLPNSVGVTIKDKDDVEETEEEAHDSVRFPFLYFCQCFVSALSAIFLRCLQNYCVGIHLSATNCFYGLGSHFTRQFFISTSI